MYDLILISKVSFVLLATGFVFAQCASPQYRGFLLGRAIWVMPVVFAASMLCGNVWILDLILLLSIPLLARSRAEAAALYPVVLLSVPFIPTDVRIGGSAILTLGTWEMASLGFLVSTWIHPRVSLSWKSSGHFLFIILFALLLIPYVRGANATTAVRGLIDCIILFAVPYFALFRSIGRPSERRIFVIGLLVAITCQACIGLYQSRVGWPIYEGIFSRLDLPLPKTFALKMRGGVMRATGSYLESTSFAGLIAMGTVAAFCMRYQFRSPSRFFIILFILFGGVYATVSRGGFLFVAIAMILAPAFQRKLTISLMMAAAVAFIYALVRLGAQRFPILGAIGGTSGDTAGTTDYRANLFSRGLEEIAKYPILGRDPPSVYMSLSDLRQGEGIVDFVNGYIYFALVGGVGAAIALFAVFMFSAKALYRATNRGGNEDFRIAQFAFAVNLALSVTTFTSGFGGPSVLPFIMIMALTSVIISKERLGGSHHRRPVAVPV